MTYSSHEYLGMNAMVHKLHDMRTIWLKLQEDIRICVKCCAQCQQVKGNKICDQSCNVIVPNHPLLHLCIDLTFLSRDHNSIGLIVIVDHMMKYAQSIPSKESIHVVNMLNEVMQEIRLQDVDQETRKLYEVIFVLTMEVNSFPKAYRNVVYDVMKREGSAYSS